MNLHSESHPLQVDRTAILIPVKHFSTAKSRLCTGGAEVYRVELAQKLAHNAYVMAAKYAQPTLISESPAVHAWARQNSLRVLSPPGRGLNVSLFQAISELRTLGLCEYVIVHSDVVSVAGLERHLKAVTSGQGAVTADRHGVGTNVLGLPSQARFWFHYGSSSFADHQKELADLGLQVEIISDARLALDLDTVDDLELVLQTASELDGALRQLLGKIHESVSRSVKF